MSKGAARVPLFASRSIKVSCGLVGLFLGMSGEAFAARTINWVRLNGGTQWTFNSSGGLVSAGSSVTVNRGEWITVEMNVTTTGGGSGNDWESTSWRISTTAPGSTTCADTPDHTSSGTYTETFTIFVDSALGTFNAYFRAHDANTCSTTDQSPLVTLSNSVTVEEALANPPLADACGLDIVLVVDTSGSIGGNMTTVKNAAKDFVDAFIPGTPTRIGLVHFSTASTIDSSLTNDATALKALIDTYVSSGFTNWEQALLQATSILEGVDDRDDDEHPDMIVFFTDGDPTISSAGGGITSQPNIHLGPAVAAAEAAKQSSSTNPIRIVVVGVGAVATNRLIAISGPNVSPPSPIDETVDVILGSFSSLAEALSDLALGMCGGTVTVTKIIDQDGNLATTGDQSEGEGWTFSITVDPPDSATPGSGMTNNDGQITFDIDLGEDLQATVTVTETVQSGYHLISAMCTSNNGGKGMPSGNSVTNIFVGNEDIVTCVFYNGPDLGACCDQNVPGGECTDDVDEPSCQGDGFVWTGGADCSEVECCSSDEQCTDNDVCTIDACDPDLGCTYTPIDCDDNNPCTEDSCHPIAGCINAPKNCSDGVACTVDSCDPQTGDCLHTPNDAACDNGLWCDGTETCHPTLGCQAGTPVVCNDGVDCTTDTCDEANDQCLHQPSHAFCNDGVACTTDVCDPVNGCVNTPDDAVCDNGLWCDGAETCHPTLGCQAGTPPNCNDGVDCTVDTCNETTDSCDHAPNHGACNDGLYCNGVEVCDPINGCQAGTPVNCDDGVDCTIDSCNEATDSCDHTPNHGACNDGLYCNGVEVCHPTLGCQAGAPPNCNDGIDCTVDSCDEDNDVCVHDPNDAVCDDGQYCNGVETCDPLDGCQAGTPVNCGDGLPCTIDTCDEVNDVCVHTPNDAACNDGQYCNGEEYCDPNLGCQAGPPPNCDDGVPCTVDTCDEVNDVCVNSPNDGLCNDGLWCNGLEYCDPVLGCQNGTPPNCDDGVDCTDDSCDEMNDVCVHDPNDMYCDDGLFCNGEETCDPVNGCLPGFDPCPMLFCDEDIDACVDCLDDGDCDDGLYCNGMETCVSGVCMPGTPPNCNDGVACTVDSCDELNDVCVNAPNDGLCNDGQYCNGVETCHPTLGCQAGTPVNCDDGVDCTIDTCDEVNDVCVHTPDPTYCDDGFFCNGVEICHPTLGCQAGTPPGCGDGVSCTIDWCDEDSDSCMHTPTDSLCNDGLYCNGVETCDPINDCQAGTPPNCKDGIGCTIDTCDEDNDVCVHTPNDGACNDGQFCNGVETCDPQLGCQAGTPVDCDDGVDCTIDTCNEATDTCDHTPDHGSCSDGEFCNGAEVCDPMNGCMPGTPPNCDDGVPCTVDSCNEQTDMCDHMPNDALCNDGLFCNGVEVCHPLNGCQAGTPPNCNDGVACTVDSCNEATDSCDHTPNDALCDDGQFCNGVEVCNPTTGCVAGAPPNCDDGVACTLDKCDEANDLCRHLTNNAACDDGNTCTLDTCTLAGCEYQQRCGACCILGGGCMDAMSAQECDALGTGVFLGVGTSCVGDGDGDGFDDACPVVIPTVSEWGLVILTLLLCAGGKLYFGRRRLAEV